MEKKFHSVTGVTPALKIEYGLAVKNVCVGLDDPIHIRTVKGRDYKGTLVVVRASEELGNPDIIRIKCGDSIVDVAIDDIDLIEA